MNWKQHIASGMAITAFDVFVFEHLKSSWHDDYLRYAFDDFGKFIMPGIIPTAIGIIFLFVGFILPDCDNPDSIVGRYFNVPFEHRTWTHAIWFPAMFTFVGLFLRPFLYLSFGYMLHLFMDSFSRCGVCFFYPITKYKHYGKAKVKRGHFLFLYASDSFLAWFWCIVLIVAAFLYVLGYFGILPFLFDKVNSFIDPLDIYVKNILEFFKYTHKVDVL